MEILYTKASQENLDVLKFSACTFTDGCENFAWESDGGYKYKGCYPGIYRGMDALQMTRWRSPSLIREKTQEYGYSAIKRI